MKIALVHNFYRLRGGEDAVVEREVALLRQHAHEVVPFYRDSGAELEVTGFWEKVEVARDLAFKEESYEAFTAFLEREKPDVVHVHNTFPLLSPSVLKAAKDKKIPVVLTLHNFRFICANGLFLRNALPCEKCLNSSSLWGAFHGCYRDSPLATVPITRMIQKYEKGAALAKWVNRFVVLSEFSRQKFLQAGIPEKKILVKPNFCEDPGVPPAWEDRQEYVLFVGRLSEEKGVLPLVQAWEKMNLPLKIVGTGPLEKLIRELAHPKIELLGAKSQEQVRKLMREAKLLVIPSICYENFPLVLAEAWANGLPVLARKLGSLESLIEEGKTGFFFAADAQGALLQAVHRCFSQDNHLKSVSLFARKAYETNFSPEAGIRALENVYAEARP